MKIKGAKIYFLGIGGIGMSALARWFKANGASVLGYDLVQTSLTNELTSEGINIHYTDNPNLIPSDITMVIYTPAIPESNSEFQYLRDSEIPVYKRAEIIGKLSEDLFTVAIGGTHGKTSITALTAHILKNAGLNITALVGGICKNYNSNLILSNTTDVFVVEADEFDRSLLKISPDIAVITSADNDHLDIYKDNQDIRDTFINFALKIPEKGKLIYNSNLDFFSLPEDRYSYGTEDADFCGKDIRIEKGFFVFDFVSSNNVIKNIKINTPGIHNIENSVAAAAVASFLGVDNEAIIAGIESFKGVERRMEIKISSRDFVFIDDYAHHPAEIKTTIDAIRRLHPNKKLTVIFQPHLFSRTRDFADEFAHELSKADNVLLLDIYPAREKSIPGITSHTICDKIKDSKAVVTDRKSILKMFQKDKPELLLTIGAGDIGIFAKKLENEFKIDETNN